ncbi:unnamed protein product [Lactuca saligna]|uniref:Uncharacterized protein n=1 Tax=Lactuca saligna TaxID=75948 RepID=A0AA35Y350_LACSI|nr:unnamed protein product [Lactuca saligna]
MCVIFSNINMDYGSMLWAQLVQSTLSTTPHSEISCARFGTIVVQRVINKLNIPVLEDSHMVAIQIFHTTNIILADNRKFNFSGSIPESMLRDVPAASDILRAYGSLPVSSFLPITDEVQKILAEAVKPKKGGKNRGVKAGPSEPPQASKKKAVKKPASRPQTPTPSNHDDSQSNTVSEVTFEIPTSVPIRDDCIYRVSQQQTTLAQSTPLFTDSTPTITTTIDEPPMFSKASNVGAGASGFTFSHSTQPISPLCQNDPDTIFGEHEEDFGCFAYISFNIRTESDDDTLVTKTKLKDINEKLDSLIKASKTLTSDEYSQAKIKSFLETLTKEHPTNLDMTNIVVDASTSVCKEMMEKVDKLITNA